MPNPKPQSWPVVNGSVSRTQTQKSAFSSPQKDRFRGYFWTKRIFPAKRSMFAYKSHLAFLPGFLSINPLGSCDLGKLLYHHHDNQHLHSPTTSTLTLSWPSTLWMKINIEFSKICYGFPKVYLVNTFIYICIFVIIINIGNCNQFWYCPTLLLTRQKYSPASPVLTEVRFKSNLEYVHKILILITE